MWQNAHASLRLTESSLSKNKILPNAGMRSGLPGKSDGIPGNGLVLDRVDLSFDSSDLLHKRLGRLLNAASSGAEHFFGDYAAARKQKVQTKPSKVNSRILRLALRA